MILARESWPSVLADRSEVRGVFVGGCVDRGDGSRFRAKAHTHTGGQNAGYICVLAARRLSDRDLMLHELAHLLAGERGHTDTWRKWVLLIGGTLSSTASLRDYHKHSRTRHA